MSIVNARMNAIAWKKSSLEKLRQSRSLVREFNTNLDKLFSSVKTLAKDVDRGARQISKQYDKYLDEDSESYEQDADAATGLQEITNADEQVDETQLQVDESFESLLSSLDDIIAAIQEIKP
jgi:methyl-accepting chemotaxis protein